MHPILACVPPPDLDWFHLGHGSPNRLIVVGWLLCAAAHGWLACRSRAVHRTVEAVQSLAVRGDWSQVLRVPRLSKVPAIAAGISLLVVPATVWRSYYLAYRPPKTWLWVWEERERLVQALWEWREALNLCASFALFVGILLAFAWGSNIADWLRFRGLQRAARLALLAPSPTIGSPFRRHARFDDLVAAWVAAPGPRRATMVAGAIFLAVAAVVPMSIGIHDYFSGAADAQSMGAWFPRGKGADYERQLCLIKGEASLEKFSGIAVAGGALGVVAICAALLAPAMVRRRRCAEVEPGTVRLWVSAACLGGTLLLTWVTRPYAQENALPFVSDSEQNWGHRGETIGLGAIDAPDEIDDEVVVDVGAEPLEGKKPGTKPYDAKETLQMDRDLWRFLHPERKPPGVVILACRPGATARQLTRIAEIAAAEGYTTALLAAARRVHQTRPLLGHVTIEIGSAVKLQIDDPDAAATISESDFATCADILQEGARLRREGMSVGLATGG
ncbi:MAG: hypothetical protein HY898_00370 [Deltaproteobacteria bacterium]|nr:hypothetical protein [Deltaproteobacteria bacterium]